MAASPFPRRPGRDRDGAHTEGHPGRGPKRRVPTLPEARRSGAGGGCARGRTTSPSAVADRARGSAPVAPPARDRLVRQPGGERVDGVVEDVDGDLLAPPEDERRGHVE